MAFTTTMIHNNKPLDVYVDEGLRTPGQGDRLTMIDPETGRKRDVVAGAEAWMGSEEMAPPAGAIKLEFTTKL